MNAESQRKLGGSGNGVWPQLQRPRDSVVLVVVCKYRFWRPGGAGSPVQGSRAYETGISLEPQNHFQMSSDLDLNI